MHTEPETLSADQPTTNRPPLPAWLKGLLEYGPLVVLLLGFLLFRKSGLHIAGQEWSGLVAATAVFVPAQVVATLVLWRLSGHLQAMQVVTLVLVVGLGGFTVWADNPDYIRMKPTFLYLLIAAVLGLGLAMGRNWLNIAFGQALQMDSRGWRVLTLRFILLCLGLAIANEIVWRNMSESFWLGFKLVALPLAIFGFMLANYRLVLRHQTDQPGKGD